MQMMRLSKLASLVLALLALPLGVILALSGGDGPVAAQSADFTVEETTFASNYPRGMTFTIRATSSAGDITRATLYYVLRPGTRERENAEFDAESGAWVARPYSVRGGLPPWIDFDYYWVLADAAGNTYETEPQYGVYADHTREWWSIDTEDITLYWFGELPELGDVVAETMVAMRQYFTEGWGRTLSYKPLAILFPPGRVWDEYVEGGVDPDAAGFTNNGWGYTLQRIPTLQDPLSHEAQRYRCGGYWYGSRPNTPEEWQLQDTVHSIVHEIVHLYQSDFRVRGPYFWTEGQADYFASLFGWRPRDAVSRMLAFAARGYELPTLQGEGPGGGRTESVDGCHAFGYAIGEHFIRWLVDAYGGLEVHARVVEAMPGRSLAEALEVATGVPFLELENQYRAFLGYPPIQPLPTPTPYVFPTAPVPSLPTPSGGS